MRERTSAPSVLIANLDVPARNSRELIALMKQASQPYQVGSPGTGSSAGSIHAWSGCA